MAILPVFLGLGQKCPKCRQRSSPRPGQGNWEVIGVWNGAVHKCTRCMTLVRPRFFSDVPLSADESRRIMAAREAEIKRLEEITGTLPSHPKKPVAEWIEQEIRDIRSRSQHVS